MKETALVIMAAGIGSRFGGGIKQLAAVGPNGEIIMDYSIFDAMEACFNRVVFVIRKVLPSIAVSQVGNIVPHKLGVGVLVVTKESGSSVNLRVTAGCPVVEEEFADLEGRS